MESDIIWRLEELNKYFKLLALVDIRISKNDYSIGSLSTKLYIRSDNKLRLGSEPNKAIRQAYYGGRCETFGNALDHEKILHFDFRGCYQMCMEEDLPYGRFVYVSHITSIDKPGYYFIEAFVIADIPVLPQFFEKLLFPHSFISGLFWWEEVLLALGLNQLKSIRIIYGLIPESYDKVLSDFIKNLSSLRSIGEGGSAVGKVLINSFYGRLGMADSAVKFSLDLKKNGSSSGRASFGFTKHKIKLVDRSNIGVAAAITAKARIKLYKGFLSIMEAGGRPLYCDTDSIFAAFPRGAAVENRQLGEIYFDTRHSDTEIKDAVFIAPKTYAIKLSCGDIIKIKGGHAEGIDIPTLKEYFYLRKPIRTSTYVSMKRNNNIEINITHKTLLHNTNIKRRWAPCMRKTESISISEYMKNKDLPI